MEPIVIIVIICVAVCAFCYFYGKHQDKVFNGLVEAYKASLDTLVNSITDKNDKVLLKYKDNNYEYELYIEE